MRKVFFALCLSCISLFAFAQQKTITKQTFHWGRPADTTAGYTQAILTDNVLYVSGTVGSGKTMEEQMKSLYTNIGRTLKHFGLSFQNVVKENLYTVDIEATKAANGVRKPFYQGEFPAATWVQISRLYMPTALVEVEVVAHLPRQ